MPIIPKTVDGVPLTGSQREVLADLVSCLVADAGHDLEDALPLAETAFRSRLYRVEGDRWVANETVDLGGHGKIHRGRAWLLERREER